jgi:hypothetical protein
MRKVATVFLIAGAVAVASLLPDAAEAGRTKKWRANNNTSSTTVKVFWTATGCAGTSSNCAKSGSVTYVCKHEVIHPGGSDEYRFDDGTSNREKRVCAMEGPGMKHMRRTSTRKENGLRLKTDGSGIVEWYNE